MYRSADPDARPAVRSSSAAAIPYVLPMAVLLTLLAVGPALGLGPSEYPIRTVVVSAVLWFASRRQIDLKVCHWGSSAAVGLAVFLIWITPELVWPGYREFWLFQNALTGPAGGSIPVAYRAMPLVLVSRAVRATLLVPIVEELFWRGWLMRWLINPHFLEVRLGTFQPYAFFVSAVLFATVHGVYWDVALAAGIVYNAWMVRTRSLADCIFAHAVTNGLLSLYVVTLGQWQYW